VGEIEWLARISAAADELSSAEQALAAARSEYRKSITQAYASGVSMAAIGRALGITRQRVNAIIVQGLPPREMSRGRG
jgi:DNA-directed RNA polymerase specialized sigma24 family protein